MNKTEELREALDCTIEHLDGVHDGRIVVHCDVFDALYEAAQKLLVMAEMSEAGYRMVPGEADGEMIRAGLAEYYHPSVPDVECIYAAMISDEDKLGDILGGGDES